MLSLLALMLQLQLGVAAAAAVTTHHTLNSGRIVAKLSPTGLTGMGLLPPPPTQAELAAIAVGHLVATTAPAPAPVFMLDASADGFRVDLGGFGVVDSAVLGPGAVSVANDTAFGLEWVAPHYRVDAVYTLAPGATFLTKAVWLTGAGCCPDCWHADVNFSAAAPFNGIKLVPSMASVAATPPTTFTSKSHYGLGDYAVFARWGADYGAFLTAHNPYLAIDIDHDKGAFTVGYTPQLQIPMAQPTISVDRAVLGIHRLSGRTLGSPADPLDESEQHSLMSAVQSELVVPQNPDKTVKINIAWTENDYQLDIALPGDAAAYKRIIDRASQFGITHILFAPQNSDASSARNNTDAWGWEQLLWFGMGQSLRQGTWKPGDPLPPSLTDMLDYFKAKHVKPVAYVYPILAFLAHTYPGNTNPPWIVNGTYYSGSETPRRLELGSGPLRSSLGSPEFQQWLPDTMVNFAEATGAGGFSFDYTYFEEQPPVASQYAQWAGWRTILNRLHTAKGGNACGGEPCVVDNRQQNHVWGPWMWAQGGTYAEPLMSDEQPGSWMFYEADLHTDRLSANEERFVAWNYRQLEFCPPEVLPGFAFHQTDRDPTVKQKAGCGLRCSNFSRARDFDFLGYRYSLLSSIGTGGLNNVINMLPARDTEEFDLLPAEDLEWVSKWMKWTDDNVGLLQQTKVLPMLPQPSAGRLDGVVMLGNNEGAMFVYNPTANPLPLSVTLDSALGFDCSLGLPVIVNVLGSSDRGAMPHHAQIITCGDTLNYTIPATTAIAFEFDSWGCVSGVPQVYGLELTQATVNRTSDSAALLDLQGVQGEAGTESKVFVAMPPGTPTIKTILVNGASVTGPYSLKVFRDVPTVSFTVKWAGVRFSRNQQIGTTDGFTGGSWTGRFTVPKSVMDQLTTRNKTYPVVWDTNPEGNNDPNVPWLAPGRLVVFAKYMPLLDDTFNATGTVDGKPIIVRKAYNTVVRSPARFIGYWADVTDAVVPGTTQELALELPQFVSGWTTKQGALLAGSDLDSFNGTAADAEKKCGSTTGCVGFTWKKQSEGDVCGVAGATSARMYLKSSMSSNADAAWCNVVKPASIDGVYFENVETIYSAELASKPTPPGGQCAGSFTPGTRPGQDYASVKMSGTAPTARECQAMCCHDPKCATWVYVPAGLYPKRPPGTFCWLKAAPISLKGSTCDNGKPGCVSGVVNRTTTVIFTRRMADSSSKRLA